MKAVAKTQTRASKISSPFRAGKGYFFRLATYHVVGIVKAIHDVKGNIIVELCDASWIGDSGRFHNAMRDGFEKQSDSEIEPTGIHFFSLSALIDAMPYNHPMPTSQK